MLYSKQLKGCIADFVKHLINDHLEEINGIVCKIQTSKRQRAQTNSSSQRMEAECKTTSDIAVVIHPEASLSEMSQVFAALYFLCKQRIAHTTNYEPILDLIGLLGN